MFDLGGGQCGPFVQGSLQLCAVQRARRFARVGRRSPAASPNGFVRDLES